jgi:hypothetical protein
MAQAITESTRFALQQRAREVLGEQEGDTLMAHLPPVGWADVATKQDLEALSKDIEALRVATKQDIEALRVATALESAAVRKEIEALRKEMSKDMDILGHRLDAKLERGLRRQTLWIVSVLFAQSGLLAWLLERGAS